MRPSLRRPSLRHGYVLPLVILVLALAGGAAYYFSRAAYSAGGKDADAILHEVGRSEFRLSVTERGEIESSGMTEIRSEVKAKNTAGIAILRVVPEGTEVKAGDFLVELDSSALAADLTAQQIAVNTTEALVVESHNLYETALIAQREYLEGTFVQERQTIESEVFVAEENLNRAREYYQYSKRLAAKGYVNELQLQADKFAVEKSQKELDAAKTKLNVLSEFTRAKTMKQLESDIAIAKAKWESDKKSHELELGKLKEIQDQIAKCVITAPRDGIVTYAHEFDHRGGSEFVVQEGAVIRERQPIIKLPDPNSMRVQATINESLVRYVKKGMPATVVPVGLDVVLRGQVDSVNQYAEPGGWRKANVKEYKAFVSILEPHQAIRSGMTASITIQCARVENAIQAPVQAVYSHGRDYYCLARQGNGWQAHKIATGPTNDKFFVVESGLDAGDRIALDPRRYLDQVELPPLPAEQRQQIVRIGPELAASESAETAQGDGTLIASGAVDRRPARETSGDAEGRNNDPAATDPDVTTAKENAVADEGDQAIEPGGEGASPETAPADASPAQSTRIVPAQPTATS